jgi:GTP:adenosylcobinamide-phosphate guanylyltransferase
MAIQVIETKYRCLGVDTPADLARVERVLQRALREQAKAKLQPLRPRGKTRSGTK